MLHRFDSIDKEDSDVTFTGLNQVFKQQTINLSAEIYFEKCTVCVLLFIVTRL